MILYLYLLRSAEIMANGGTLSEVFGFKAKTKLIPIPGSPLEDEDVTQERTEVEKIIKTRNNVLFSIF